MDKENQNVCLSDNGNSEGLTSNIRRKSILKNLDPFYNKSPELSINSRAIKRTFGIESSPLINLGNENNKSNNKSLIDNISSNSNCNDSNPLINLGNIQDSTNNFNISTIPDKNFTERETFESVNIDDISLYLKQQDSTTEDVHIDDLLSLDKCVNKVMSIERVNDIRKYHQSKMNYFINNDAKLSLDIQTLKENLDNHNSQYKQEKTELQNRINQLLLENSEKDLIIKKHEENMNTISVNNEAKHQEQIDILEEQLHQSKCTTDSLKNAYETKINEFESLIKILQKENNQVASAAIKYMTLLEQYSDMNNELEEQLKISKSEYNNLETYLPDILSKFHKAKDVIAKQESNEKEITSLNNKLKIEIKELKEALGKETDFAEKKYKEYEAKLSLLSRQATLIMETDHKIEKENQIKMNLFGEMRRTLNME